MPGLAGLWVRRRRCRPGPQQLIITVVVTAGQEIDLYQPVLRPFQNEGPFLVLQICTRRYFSGVKLRDRIHGDAHSEGLTLIKGAHASGEDHAGIPATNDLPVRTESVSRKRSLLRATEYRSRVR